MKICWDNLENFWLTKNGNFNNGQNIYSYKENCENCGDSYLTLKFQSSKFCCRSCAHSGEYHHMFGKKRPEHSKKMSVLRGKNHPHFNKSPSEESRQKMSEATKGEKHPNYKGGVTKINIPIYDTFAYRISYAEEVRRNPENVDWLQVKCAYCGKWYTPTAKGVYHRIDALEGKTYSECRFYCSENCKQACPIYRQRKYPKDFKHATSREVDPQLRQMVLERDGWVCQKCGKTTNEAELHCHHMDPVVQNPMLQNDIDSCITLCKDCHKEVHLQYGCRYVDLKCIALKEKKYGSSNNVLKV